MLSIPALTDLVFPSRCAVNGCHGPGPLCPACARGLANELNGGTVLALPTPCPAGLPPTWVCGDYTGVLRQILLSHKERGRADLTSVLAGVVTVALQRAAHGHQVVLVPVPTTGAARRRRRGHPLWDVVTLAARQNGLRVAPVLTWVRSASDQSGLGSRARAANLAGALWAPPGLPALGPRRRVVLVDDIVTTGATLAEAARALTAAGANSGHICAVAMARTRHNRALRPGPIRPAPD